MTVPTSVRLARAYLSMVAEPPAPALCAFVASVGPVRAAALVRRGEVPTPVASETNARRTVERAEHDLRAAEAVGARLLVPEDVDWPAAAFHAFELSGHPHLAAPVALWVRGPARLNELTERSVAIVGARAATPYGHGVANTLGYGVARLGGTVFSGAAFGIDAAAHRGALAADGLTVAVLARGVDRPYPAAHHRLIEHIAERGLVVSEYPPGAVPARHRFLVRNRIIAGLAGGTVVVEAGWRSGARRTASDAALLGRPLMAVPGPVTSALSVGCHRLLREPGTIAVTSAEEVLEEVGRIGGDLAPLVVPGDLPRPTDRLSPIELRVHEALRDGRGTELSRLGVECGLPPELVRAALVGLERAGLADRDRAGWRLREGGERRGDA
ncbi:MAG TPA: DNA-processing protein DprA [Pseudonocardia sp.]|jgi:DNA processing protein